MKILIVEDDKAISKSIVSALADYVNIDCAYDGDEGLFYAEANIYDCIILDIMLPGASGFDILSRIRKNLCCSCAYAYRARAG